MAPHHPKAVKQPTHEMVPIRTVQIRLNFDAAPPRRWKTRHLSQPRPTTLQHPNPNGPTHHQIASHMASTIWHTVEFSRNRRASPRDLSISSERLCRSESYLAFGPLPATLFGRHLRAGSPSPPASGRTKRLETRAGVATLGTSHRGSIRGVRSSLSGDIENITRVLRQVSNRSAVTPVTRGARGTKVQVSSTRGRRDRLAGLSSRQVTPRRRPRRGCACHGGVRQTARAGGLRR